MGQFALGLRSLLIKSAVFIVMAALLAWALGGTLWPRPARVEFPAGRFAGRELFWRLTVRYSNDLNQGFPDDSVEWELLLRDKDGKSQSFDQFKGAHWMDVAGPVFANGNAYVGVLVVDPGHSGRSWVVVAIDERSKSTTTTEPLPDRLAVEQQLARVKAGLPLQDSQTILAQRSAVLDPGPKTAEKDGTTDEHR